MKHMLPLILLAALCSGCGALSYNVKMSLLCGTADLSAALAMEAKLVSAGQVTEAVEQIREVLADKHIVEDIIADIEADLPKCPVVDAVLAALKAELYGLKATLTGRRRIRIENILVGWERRAQLWIE